MNLIQYNSFNIMFAEINWKVERTGFFLLWLIWLVVSELANKGGVWYAIRGGN